MVSLLRIAISVQRFNTANIGNLGHKQYRQHLCSTYVVAVNGRILNTLSFAFYCLAINHLGKSVFKKFFQVVILSLKTLFTTAADAILNFFFFFLYFSEYIRLDIPCESLARQMIHMKCQVLFSL